MFKILDEVCKPTKGTEFSVCVDLYAREDVVIGAGETVLVPLGVQIDLEYLRENFANPISGEAMPFIGLTEHHFMDFMRSHQLNLHIRSSMSAKHGLVIANGTGIIDLDYEDEIMICLHNPVTKNDIANKAIYYVNSLMSTLKMPEAFSFKHHNDKFIKKGDKIAQISLVEHKTYLLGVESEEKRTGGFGSTDTLD